MPLGKYPSSGASPASLNRADYLSSTSRGGASRLSPADRVRAGSTAVMCIKRQPAFFSDDGLCRYDCWVCRPSPSRHRSTFANWTIPAHRAPESRSEPLTPSRAATLRRLSLATSMSGASLAAKQFHSGRHRQQHIPRRTFRSWHRGIASLVDRVISGMHKSHHHPYYSAEYGAASAASVFFM